MTQKLRIGYFGLPLGALAVLRDGHDIVFIALSPARRPGARRLRRLLGVEKVFDALGLGPRLDSAIDEVLSLIEVDVLVSWFWSRRLPERWLMRPKLEALGAHPSLLPRHRGPDPYFWAIDQGDPVTGVTVHRLDPEYDTGAVLLRRSVDIGELNAGELAKELDRVGIALLREALGHLENGEALHASPQNEVSASWAPEPQGEALRVDWKWPTERVLRRIRALSPHPGLAVEIRGLKLFVVGARRASLRQGPLGAAEAVVLAEGTPPTLRLCIGTADGAIQIERGVMGLGCAIEPGTLLGAAALGALAAQQGVGVLAGLSVEFR